MFKKEAEEFKKQIQQEYLDLGKNGAYPPLWERIGELWEKGAEFGYNKANEWHYVSKKDYPKNFKDIWICFITEEDMKDYVRGWYEYDIELDEHYFKTSNDFGIVSIKNVYAWMPLVPSKEM